MKRFLIFCLLFTASLTAFSQTFPSEVWHEGRLVLMEGDTLKGHIKYNLETDLVQFTTDRRTIKTFTARKLLFFEIFDSLANGYRQFYALPYSIKNSYKAPIIFEVLLEGRFSLLSREALEYQVTNNPYSVSGTYTRLLLVYTHFFLKPDGTIIRFSGKKKDLLSIMKDKGGVMKKFFKEDRIKPERRSDLIKATVYYNSLFDK